MSITDPPYTRNTGFLLSRVGAMCEASWFHLISQEGVGQAEFMILSVLHAGKSMRQRDTALHAGIEPRNVVAVVDRLQSRGLIETHVTPNDKRVKQLAITSRGAELMVRLGEKLRAEGNRFFEPLNEEDRAKLTDLLIKIYDSRAKVVEP